MLPCGRLDRTTEAVLMAERITGRRRVLVAHSLHPEYATCFGRMRRIPDCQVEELSFSKSGTLDEKALRATIRDDVAGGGVQSPNFFGCVEAVPALSEIAHSAGALLVVAITEGVSLGALPCTSDADIVVMEGQSFGLPPSYGGPFVGRDCFARENLSAKCPGVWPVRLRTWTDGAASC